MLDYLRGLNLWWDSANAKAKFWWWLIGLLGVPVILSAMHLWGLFLVFTVLIAGARGWYVLLDDK